MTNAETNRDTIRSGPNNKGYTVPLYFRGPVQQQLVSLMDWGKLIVNLKKICLMQNTKKCPVAFQCIISQLTYELLF